MLEVDLEEEVQSFGGSPEARGRDRIVGQSHREDLSDDSQDGLPETSHIVPLPQGAAAGQGVYQGGHRF